MQLYHLLMQWIDQEAAENDKGFFKRMKKKGVSFIPVRREEKQQTDPLMMKWEQAFIEAQKDGLPILHYRTNDRRERLNDDCIRQQTTKYSI